MNKIPNTVPIPSGYRMLKNGEVVKKGDLFRTENDLWLSANDTIGIKYATQIGTCFIRRVHRKKHNTLWSKFNKWSDSWSTSQFIALIITIVILGSSGIYAAYKADKNADVANYWFNKYIELKVQN